MFIKTDGGEAFNSLFTQSLRIVKACDDPDVYALEAKLVSGATELIGCYNDEEAANKRLEEIVEMLNACETPLFEEVKA